MSLVHILLSAFYLKNNLLFWFNQFIFIFIAYYFRLQLNRPNIANWLDIKSSVETNEQLDSKISSNLLNFPSQKILKEFYIKWD